MMLLGNKIIVVGCPGSGKSVFSRKLQESTGLPLFHLDNIWWNDDRTHISREEFDCRLSQILATDKWIIDGYYSRTFEVRASACDTIIFLDYSEETCMDGILRRIGTERPDIPWVENQLDPELVQLVRDFHREKRQVLYALMEQYPEKQAIIFKTRDEADQWVSVLQNQMMGALGCDHSRGIINET